MTHGLRSNTPKICNKVTNLEVKPRGLVMPLNPISFPVIAGYPRYSYEYVSICMLFDPVVEEPIYGDRQTNRYQDKGFSMP